VARALAYDYVGALAASLLFPLLLVPRLGLVRTSVVTGAVNAVIALSATFVIKVERPGLVRIAGAVVLLVLAFTFVRGESWVAAATD
jgi:spermidine synthase